MREGRRAGWAKGEAAVRDGVEAVPLAEGDKRRGKGDKREKLDGVRGREDVDVETVAGGVNWAGAGHSDNLDAETVQRKEASAK